MVIELIDSIRNALRADSRITSKKTIHVATQDGTVTLHGVVDSLDEFGIAQEIAESVPGVAAVENHLSIDGEVDTGPCCPQM
ncbi:MAG: BON domain-containing protein [Armatimonadetes bacterium]|nr:BON domain-containing protein [Armatimonadota bacterium]